MITQPQLIEAVRYVADTEPEFVYTREGVWTCTYRPSSPNHCGCIVGEALVHLGVPVALLEQLDQRAYTYSDAAWGAAGTALILQAVVAPEALFSKWVKQVQYYQDQGRSWGMAVRMADEKAEAEGWVLA